MVRCAGLERVGVHPFLGGHRRIRLRGVLCCDLARLWEDLLLRNGVVDDRLGGAASAVYRVPVTISSWAVCRGTRASMIAVIPG